MGSPSPSTSHPSIITLPLHPQSHLTALFLLLCPHSLVTIVMILSKQLMTLGVIQLNSTNPCPHCGSILPANEHVLNHLRSFCTKSIQCPGSPVCSTKCYFDVVAGGGALFWRILITLFVPLLVLLHMFLVNDIICFTLLIVSFFQEPIILAVDNKWWMKKCFILTVRGVNCELLWWTIGTCYDM